MAKGTATKNPQKLDKLCINKIKKSINICTTDTISVKCKCVNMNVKKLDILCIKKENYNAPI